MILHVAFAALALLGQAQPKTYYWRDATGQTHITNTPPPADAEVLDAPPPPAVEPGKPGRPEFLRATLGRDGNTPPALSPAQQEAWQALDRHLAKARTAGDARALRAVADSLVRDCLWGNGLWLMPVVPLVCLALLTLLGWWLALGLQAAYRVPVVTGFAILGLAFGHLFLSLFLYLPQAARLRQNLELLSRYNGTGRPARNEQQQRLRTQFQALEQAAEPLQLPWRFPVEVERTRAAMHQVLDAP